MSGLQRSQASFSPAVKERIAALGDIDELNSIIGLLLGQLEQADIREQLLQIQHDLFDLGAELSLPGDNKLTQSYVDYLQEKIDEMNQTLPPLKEFILPGGSSLLGFLHLARSVCRRSERSLVTLHREQAVNPISLQYVNRLSDLLFVMARHLNHEAGEPDVFWQHERR